MEVSARTMAEPEHMRQNGMNRAAQDGGHVLGSAAPVACEMDVAVSLPFLVPRAYIDKKERRYHAQGLDGLCPHHATPLHHTI